MSMQLLMARARMNHQAPSGGGSRYWRVYYTGVVQQSGGVASIAELQFRAETGGASLCVGGTSIRSSVYSAANEAAMAFDGNASTYWSSAQTTSGKDQWVGYVLNTPSTVAQISIRARSDFGQQSPLNFNIQSSSDGTNWIVEWTPPTQAFWTAGEIRVFTRP